MKFLKVIAFFVSIAFQANAEVVLPRILGHQMVLQQKKPIVICGTANAGEKVSVSFANKSAQTIADEKGNWKVILNPLKASFENRDMTIKGTNTIILKDILVGEVWLCSGQSNMEYTMRKNSKVDAEQAKGLNPSPINELDFANYPNIRLFLVNRKELIKPSPTHKGWDIAEGDALRNFSAVGYFFAKEIKKDLNVPVGIIASSIPGSRIVPWINEEDFANSAYFKDKNLEGDPAKFYHSMIEPLIPFAIKGFLWYQGESNCFLKDRVNYTYKMKALIDGWRKDWGAELPFYYVQIAPFAYTSSEGEVKYNKYDLPEFWEAQAAALKIPNTGMAVITDLFDGGGGIHPGYKWEVGRRLALIALDKTYGQKLISSGPVYDKMKIKNNELVLSFKEAKGLRSKEGKPLDFFELAGSDGVYHPAKAKIKGKKIVLTSAEVKNPINARFGWDEVAQPNLVNKANLPASAFRTNNQIVNQFNP
ncbi:sialate O-acetylesterase [Pedobacter alpinus]|uniref:Sialate O-acetylesterase n=1 Tax=Pedobacter alpinus TaxID=1590643 RepID=A0ABW5TLQ8_9SPHI